MTKKPDTKKKTSSKKTAAVKARSASAKKSARTKTAAKKPVQQKDIRKELIRELTVICKELDEESLQFLVRQAGVLYHSSRVQEVADESRRLTAKARALNKLKGKGYGDKYSIQVKEGDDGSYFMIGVNNYRSFFARDEMKKLVRMCHASKDSRDASRRMYAWFDRERGDILYNTDINGPTDPALETIYNYIIKTYDVKD